ncbi:ATP-binding protein [Streptomyces sp. NPDC004783]|uniref:ATP-binding protein n=1 Tax=unclassified Streptomyces TaxID=2593676 RepID=UPI00339E100C
MKQSAAKTLGVAALGAAFAAAGAGAASAAPELPDAGQTVGSVARTLPAENVTQPVTDQVADGPAQPVTELVGGLPPQGMPTQGWSVNGVPLG